MQTIGKLLEIKDAQQVSDTFKKRSFVIECTENPQYPEYVSFELIQDRCDLLENFQIGQEVEISFNLRGRKWTTPEGETKYFNSLQAWRIDAIKQGDHPDISKGNSSLSSTEGIEEEDELPF